MFGNIFQIGAFINAVLSLFLGLLVVTRRNRDRGHILFFLFAFSISLWIFFFGIWQSSSNDHFALITVKLLMTGAICIPVFFIHYIIYFSKKENEFKKWLYLFYGFTAVQLILNWSTNLILSGFRRVRYFDSVFFDFWPTAGPLFTIWLLWFFAIVIFGLFLLWPIYLNARGRYHQQAKYFIIGTIVCYAFGASVFPPWYGIDFPPIGAIMFVFYPAIFAYNILVHKMIDVKFVIGRTLIFLFSTITTLFASFIILFISGRLIGNGIKSYFIFAGTLMFGLFIYQPVFKFFELLAAKYFYYPLYSYQQILIELGKKVIKILDIKKLSDEIVKTICAVIRIEKGAVVLLENGVPFRMLANNGLDENKFSQLSKNPFFLELLARTDNPLLIDELESLTDNNQYEKQLAADLQNVMQEAEAIVCLPIKAKQKLFGYIVFGKKDGEQSYTEQDINVLNSLSHEASIAFSNAKYYSEIVEFNKNMEREVKERTKELQEANEKLVELGKVKSDFISIASHQLRSPLTVTKGYLSVIMEGDYGVVPEDVKQSLSVIYSSNERLIDFTNNLLDVKSIEEGKVKFDPQPVSLSDVVETIINQYSKKGMAQKSKMEFIKPEIKLPTIKADKLKLEQIVTNLIDNALKYSPKGKVTVSISSKDKWQTLEVKDTGEGMSQEELSMIFEKFTRGTQGRKVNVKGTGIGLYIVKKFVDLHQGKVWAESEGIGKGSRFCVSLQET